MADAIAVTHVWKSYERSKPVLRDVNFNIQRGEMVALIGASGSGKSTLIRAISGLIPIDKPEKNNADRCCEIVLCGEIMQRDGRILSGAGNLRRRIGIVFQQFNLVPRLSVLSNVLLGFLGQIPRWRGSLGLFSNAEKIKALEAMRRVGIEQHALKRGSDISGGQQQRAAIARCMVQGAEVLIADEPIASLDPSAARRVMDILTEFNRRDGITVLVSLHQVEYALRYCPRTIALRDGEVVYDGPSETLTAAFLNELYGAESAELFLPGFADRAAMTTSEDLRNAFHRHGEAGAAPLTPETLPAGSA